MNGVLTLPPKVIELNPIGTIDLPSPPLSTSQSPLLSSSSTLSPLIIGDTSEWYREKHEKTIRREPSDFSVSFQISKEEEERVENMTIREDEIGTEREEDRDIKTNQSICSLSPLSNVFEKSPHSPIEPPQAHSPAQIPPSTTSTTVHFPLIIHPTHSTSVDHFTSPETSKQRGLFGFLHHWIVFFLVLHKGRRLLGVMEWYSP